MKAAFFLFVLASSTLAQDPPAKINIPRISETFATAILDPAKNIVWARRIPGPAQAFAISDSVKSSPPQLTYTGGDFTPEIHSEWLLIITGPVSENPSVDIVDPVHGAVSEASATAWQMNRRDFLADLKTLHQAKAEGTLDAAKPGTEWGRRVLESLKILNAAD